MTRFGEILLLWQKLQSIGQFLDLHGQILYAIGHIFVDGNGPMSALISFA